MKSAIALISLSLLACVDPPATGVTSHDLKVDIECTATVDVTSALPPILPWAAWGGQIPADQAANQVWLYGAYAANSSNMILYQVDLDGLKVTWAGLFPSAKTAQVVGKAATQALQGKHGIGGVRNPRPIGPTGDPGDAAAIVGMAALVGI